MPYKKKILFLFLLFAPIFLGNAVEKTLTVTLKNKTEALIRPVTASPQDKKALYTILKDADTCRSMRDGTPWPDKFIESNYAYYVSSWQIFNDLESLGIKDHKLTFGFLIFSPNGEVMGLGGIQNSTRNEPYNEIYFEILPPYRNKGLGKHFGQFLMRFYKSIFGDKILEAIMVQDNQPSKILLTKLGFKPRLDKQGHPMSHAFPRWGNRVYDIYRYTPSENKK